MKKCKQFSIHYILLLVFVQIILPTLLFAQDFGQHQTLYATCPSGSSPITVTNPEICGCNNCECTICSTCGDGQLMGNEQCDDGNDNQTDSCRNCQLPLCGDGIWNELIDLPRGKTCDFNDPTNNGECRQNCTKCGDNIINDLSEDCDGTDTADGKLCDLNCKFKTCGDGILDPIIGETCDYAITGTTLSCRKDSYQCTFCGDGIIQVGIEECDSQNLAGSTAPGARCSSDCLLLSCGDGFLNTPDEQCDGADFDTAEGVQNGPAGAVCNSRCEIVPFCGDGVLDINEECDGNSFVTKPVGLSDAIWNNKTCDIQSCRIKIVDPCASENLESQPINYTHNHEVLGAIAATACFKGYYYGTDEIPWYYPDANGNPSGNPAAYFYNSVYDAADGENPQTNYRDTFIREAAKVNQQIEDEILNGGYAGVYVGQVSHIRSVVSGQVCYTCAVVRTTGCFAPETKLLLAGGTEVAIEDVVAGDYVLNPFTNKAVKVLSIVESYEDKPLVVLKLSNDRTIRLTETHPVYTKDGVIKAKDLTLESVIYGDHGEEISIVLKRLTDLNSKQRVLNITLDVQDGSAEEYAVLAEGLAAGDLTLQKKINEEK